MCPGVRDLYDEDPEAFGLAVWDLTIGFSPLVTRDDEATEANASIPCSGIECRGRGMGSTRSCCCRNAAADAAACCSNEACIGCCDNLECDDTCALGDYFCVCGQTGYVCETEGGDASLDFDGMGQDPLNGK